MMLATYADETGHYPDPRRTVVGLGGFLGKSDNWGVFDEKWRTICDQEGVVRPFHMADFASSAEQFKSWKGDETRRQRLMQRLVSTIISARVYPVGAVVPVEDFKSLSDDQRKQLGGDPYYVAFQQVTHQMAFGGSFLSCPPEPVAMIYARLRGYTGRAMELWEAIKQYNIYGDWMSSFTAGDPKDYTPLEAADLWAYELGRHYEYILPKEEKWRWPFEQIIDHALRIGGGHKFFEFCDKGFMLGVLGEADETK